METVSSDQALYTALPYNKTVTFVSVMRKYVNATTTITIGSSIRNFDWVAIGGWK